MKKLSVILLTWNSEKHIKPCLDSLLSAISHIDYEVIIIDNGSSDNSIRILKDYVNNRVQLVRNKLNCGVAKARNQALKRSQGEYVFILDIDTESNKEAIDEMIKCMESDQKIGVCGVRLVSSNGETQKSCRKFPKLRYKLYNALEKGGVVIKKNQTQFYDKEIAKNEAFKVDYLIGACQMIRREVLDTVGYLDENIFYGPEDADYCLRIKQTGWDILYLPYVKIIHHYQQLSHKSFFSKMSMIHLKSLAYYFWKHRVMGRQKK